MKQLLLLLALLLTSTNAAAQAMRVSGGGGSFSGGTLTSSLVLVADNTACNQALSLAFAGDTSMGLQRAAADTLLVCLNAAEALRLTTTTMTSTLGVVYSGVTDDITTGTNEDLRLHPNGTGSTVIEGDGLTQFVSDNGTTTGQIDTGSTAASLTIGSATATAGICRFARSANDVASCGKQNATAVNVPVFSIAESLSTASAGTTLWLVDGVGVERNVPTAALTITDPTDTASSPKTAGTACRMSAAGAAAWTPVETNATTGDVVCCTNTGSNAITMTDSDGVYEGPGSVVGQWDQVCMEYVTDRWVERSFSNNEP